VFKLHEQILLRVYDTSQIGAEIEKRNTLQYNWDGVLTIMSKQNVTRKEIESFREKATVIVVEKYD
jgi:hypothetical protein